MMKRASVLMILGVLLLGLVFSASGCGCAPALWNWGCDQPGETKAEGRRRHERRARINRQQFMEDLDSFWLTDQPSRLTEKRLP